MLSAVPKNLHTSHHPSPSLATAATTALSLSLDSSADHQWTHHNSYNTKEDEEEISLQNYMNLHDLTQVVIPRQNLRTGKLLLKGRCRLSFNDF